ncbi:MAG: tetratricopeptide repeat protein [Methanotrichaceae archaeon]|nr:tetratricopeptide repeat protein [Methanotrichaceae archaeon]
MIFSINLEFVALGICEITENDESRLLNNCSLDDFVGLENYTEWNSIGNIEFQKHDYVRAICRYNKSIMVNPFFVDPWNNRGAAFSHLGRNDDALRSYDKALEIDPNNSIIWNNKGAILWRMGRYNESQRCLDKSIDFDSKNAASWNNKGIVLYEIGNFNDALKCFNNSISLNLYSAEAWNNKGAVYANQGNYNEALYCFKNAAMINQNLTEAWINGGMVLSILGELNKSERSFSVARELGYEEAPQEYLVITEYSLIIEPQKSQGLIEIFSAIIKSIPQKISNWRIDSHSTISSWPLSRLGPHGQ